ncbi:MAG: hypothetical protein H0X39_00155 [Actinobacteria bacterium]|nr:hypothetical protein [Actinomycetota bacterium]
MNARPYAVPERNLEPPTIPSVLTETHYVLAAQEAYRVWRWLTLRRATGEEGLDCRVIFASGQLADAQEDLRECGLWIDQDGNIIDFPQEIAS